MLRSFISPCQVPCIFLWLLFAFILHSNTLCALKNAVAILQVLADCRVSPYERRYAWSSACKWIEFVKGFSIGHNSREIRKRTNHLWHFTLIQPQQYGTRARWIEINEPASSTCNGPSLHTLNSEMPFSQWVKYDFRGALVKKTVTRCHNI